VRTLQKAIRTPIGDAAEIGKSGPDPYRDLGAARLRELMEMPTDEPECGRCRRSFLAIR
jgi:hypothetical protein